MMKGRRLAIIGLASAILLAVVSMSVVGGISLISLHHQSTTPTQNIAYKSVNPEYTNYSSNGLSCSLPIGTSSYIEYLVPRISESSGFLGLANGNPYLYEYADNITNRVITIGGMYEGGTIVGGTTENLPPVVEMVFYTYGPNTNCGETSSATALNAIVVQVPVENGLFNITGASFHLTHARE